jgi:hypothetical protein
MDALRESGATLTVYVHPSNAGDVRRAVALQLSSLLFSCVPYPSPNPNSLVASLRVRALGQADVAQVI